MAPRLRRDLVATTVEEEGVTYVEVTDPLTSTSFRFYDFEYALAQQLMGQPLAEVVVWASTAYGVELSSGSLDDFVDKLGGLGFLVGRGSTGPAAVPMEPIAPSLESNPTVDSPRGGAPGSAGDLGDRLGSGAIDADDVFSEWAPPVRATPPDERAVDFPVTASSTPIVGPGDAVPDFRIGPSDRDNDRLLPRREVLGAPLPPVSVAPDGDDEAGGTAATFPRPSTPEPRSSSPADIPPSTEAEIDKSPSLPPAAAAPVVPLAVPRPPVDLPPTDGPPARFPLVAPARRVDDAGQAQTPLASVANFIVAESSHYAPSGALDVGNFSSGVPSTKSESPPSPTSTSSPLPVAHPPRWAADLADGLDGMGRELPRPAPPRPQVVVMPPVAAPSPSAVPRVPHRRSSVFFVLLLLGALGGGAAWFLRPTAGPDSTESSAAVVHIVSPQPTTFYRWFEGTGVVVAGRDETLSFRTTGKLQDAMPPGTTFSAGETIARLQGVAARELVVNQLRSRVAFFEQLRDSRRAEGAEAAARQAELKLGARRQELAAAQTSLADLEIRPKVAGQVAELLVSKGAIIRPGAVVFRVRAAGPRATFKLPQPDAARARALGFCRVETIAGSVGGGGDGGAAASPAADSSARPIDCALSASTAEDQGQLAVDLVGAPALPVGTQVRLASARYDGVFLVPRGAIGHEGATDRLWIATGRDAKVAENRDIEVVATIDDLSLVARGISVGDAIITDPPASLQSGAAVTVAR